MLINGASTSYERFRKVPPLLEDFLRRCKSPCKRVLRGGSSLQTAPTTPHSGKSTPGRYAANVQHNREDNLLPCFSFSQHVIAPLEAGAGPAPPGHVTEVKGQRLTEVEQRKPAPPLNPRHTFFMQRLLYSN